MRLLAAWKQKHIVVDILNIYNIRIVLNLLPTINHARSHSLLETTAVSMRTD